MNDKLREPESQVGPVSGVSRKPVVIVFGNKKGGVGKTTFTLHTAGILNRYGFKVRVIDQDTQQSVYSNYGRREHESHPRVFDYHFQAEPLQAEDIEKLGEGYDFILVDSPPGTHDAATGTVAIRRSTPYAFMAADMIVVPFRMGSSDIDSGLSYVNYLSHHIKTQQKYKRKVPSAVVVPNHLNARRKWSGIYQGLKKALQSFAASEIELSDVVVLDYADFDQPQFSGQTAADLPNSRPRMLFEKLVFEKFCGPLGIKDPRPAKEKKIADDMVKKSWKEAKYSHGS